MIDKLSDDEYLLFFTNLFGLNYDYWPHQMCNIPTSFEIKPVVVFAIMDLFQKSGSQRNIGI